VGHTERLAKRGCEERRIYNGKEKGRNGEIMEEMGKRRIVNGRRKRGRDRYT
jgi:hypothetical protein